MLSSYQIGELFSEINFKKMSQPIKKSLHKKVFLRKSYTFRTDIFNTDILNVQPSYTIMQHDSYI